MFVLSLAVAAGGADAPAPPAPPAPTAVTALDAAPAANSARITWKADEGAGITGWAVQWLTFSSLEGQPVVRRRLVDPGTRECVIDGLKPGRVYSVSIFPYVKAAGGIRAAPVSRSQPPVMVRVGKAPAEKPAAPRGLNAVADGSRVRLSWEPSAELNVAGYEISRRGPGEAAAKPYLVLSIAQAAPSVQRLTVGPPLRAAGPAQVLDTGLDERKEYEYSVRAFTAGEPRKYSDPAGPVTVRTEPYAVTSDSLLIVVNTRAANAPDIAAHYCRVRGVAKPQVLRVAVPAGPELSRDEYDKLILAPVREHLRLHPRTVYILLVRGVPWRIRESGRSTNPGSYDGWDRASVDSELTLARVDDYPIDGRIPNPLFGKAVSLTPVDQILAVCRLDAADDKTAAALVDRAVDAETKGVEGIAFFDARGLKSGAYVAGDQAILRAAELMRKGGRMKVEVDENEKVVDLSAMPKTIGFYYGWYAGSFRPKNKAFRFGRGAVGAHLHSGAGNQISAESGWVGEMLAHGATAAVGVATEPFLDGFPTADGLVDALLKGRTFGEASLSASRYLSWMPMAVGDPLYRPFKALTTKDTKDTKAE